MDDYQAHPQNHGIIQARDNRIYVANNDAIMRYDGTSWQILFELSSSAIMEAIDGKIFVGGSGDFGYFNPSDSADITFHSLKSLITSKDHKFDLIHSIYESGENIYFIARFGILEYSEKGIRPYFNDVRFRGSYYMDENHFLIRNFSNNSVIEITDGKVLEHPLDQFQTSIGRSAIFQKFNDKWLLADGRNWTHWTKNGIIKPLPVAPLLFKKRIWGFDVLNDNLAAIRTYRDGVYLIDSLGNLINKLDIEDGLGQNLVFGSIIDHQGNIWLACDKGISKVEGLQEATFFKNRGGGEEAVETIVRHEGNLLVGRGLSVQKLDKGHEKSTLKEVVKLVFPSTMLSTKDRLLISSQSGLWEWTEGESNNLLNTPCRSITQSSQDANTFYLGLLDGIAQVKIVNGVLQNFKKYEGFSDQVRSILEVSTNELWVETLVNGVFKISISNPTDDKVFPSKIVDNKDEILYNGKPFLIEDKIVLASNKGLHFYDQVKEKAFPFCDLGGLFCDGSVGISAVAYDPYDDQYWLACSSPNRIFRLYKESGRFLIDSSYVLATNQQEYDRKILVEKDFVWAGGAAGLIRLKKKGYQPMTISSKLKNIVQENGVIYYSDPGLQLPPQKSALRFEVTSSFYTAPEQVMYRYKLHPYDQNWSQWTSEPFRIYTQLPGKQYQFNFQSRSGKGDISKENQVIFNVKKRLPETIWFKFLATGIIFGLVIMAVSFIRTKRQLLKDKQQKLIDDIRHEEKEKGYTSVIHATEQERSRISKDLHDGIGQQLSALKLGLDSIAKKIENTEIKSSVEEIVQSFSKSADEVRHISHQMMPRALSEKGLVIAVEELLKNAFEFSDTKYSLEYSGLTERLPEQIEISIYRVTQELINNIIKHAKASTVSVQLISKQKRLMVFIEDDGKGFNSSETYQGHGLLNIKSRVDMVKGSVNFEPAPDTGTFVSITVPLQNHA